MANDVINLRDNVKVEFYIPTAGNWIWSVSTWDGGDVFGGSSSSMAWTDLLCETFEIEIERGCDVNSGILLNPGKSVASIKMQSATYDPFANGTIHAGTPVQVSVETNPDTDPGAWTTIFTGNVGSFSTSYTADGLNQINIVAVDAMQAFLNTRLASYSITAGSTAADNIDALVTAYWPGSWYLDTDFITQLAATTYTDTTIGEIMNDLLNSELGYLWASRDGELTFMCHNAFDNIINNGAIWFFSTTHSTDVDHICMSDLNIDSDNRNLPNQLALTYGGGTVTRTNQDAFDLYGAIALDVTAPLYTAADVTAWFDAITLTTRMRRVQSITFQPIQRDGTMRAYMASDNLFQCVNVDYAKNALTVNEDYIITRQRDVITPTSWDITLELWRGI